MSILASLFGYVAVKSTCKGVTAWNYKQIDKKEKEIQHKYRCDGRNDPRFAIMITACNARYVDYIKELNEFRASYGKSPIISIQEAENQRKNFLEIYKYSERIDSAGYILDCFGKRQN